MSDIRVGDQIADGMAVVIDIDTDDNIVTIVVPADKSWTGEPFTLTFKPGQTVAFVESVLSGMPPA